MTFSLIIDASAESVLLRLLAQHPKDPLVVLDGSNRFNPYALSRVSPALLPRVLVSRAFTCYQMEELARQRWPAPRAVVLGLLETFLEQDVPFPTAHRLLVRTVGALSGREGVCVEAPPRGPRAERLMEVLRGRGHVVDRFGRRP